MKRSRQVLWFALALTVAHLCSSVSRGGHPFFASGQLAYIGPGAGFAFLGSFLTVLLSLLASLISLCIWPFRMLWLAVRRKGRFGNAAVKKVIILGLDGLEPKLTERWMAEGKLPNLRELAERGSYSHLRTTFPPLSPVAWSTFATGVNPAGHNIFDFLNRNLQTYAPELSSARVIHSTKVIKIFKWEIPLSRPSVELRRKSKPFWEILGNNGIGSTILRIPVTFPAVPFRGRLLSAMSTPDLRGTQGSFSWFSTDLNSSSVDGGLKLPLTPAVNGWQGSLPGPADTLVQFTIELVGNNAWRLRVADQAWELIPGEYSPWIRLRFPAPGIVRFLLTRTQPAISLYVTPVEIDPEAPALPISHPSHYAVYLAKLLGSFATLGLAEDTWALNEGAIDEDSFLKQAKLIQAEREAMFFSALDRTRRGVAACVFDTTDRVQHMFYRHLDAGGPYAHVIEDLYRDMDRVVGRTLRYVNKDTALFVLSDHGFCSFRRGINLNSWLLKSGYLALQPGRTESGDYFECVDWSRTRVYTFGLSGLYLNLQGRESQGIVPEGDAAKLRAELRERLTDLPDDVGGKIAIQAVYESKNVYHGPYLDAAPDLIVGYAPGYRASWGAAVGKVTKAIFEDNNKCWSGDHCVDPSAVPGVLFANRPCRAQNPGIEDMAPTILRLFGIDPPSWMEGRPLLR
jgi:predicted AlkP superfamily phosphohydrolase/phosphomutase